MDYSVGDRVISKITEQSGFIREIENRRAVMVYVNWEVSDKSTWLPIDEVRPWDKGIAPIPRKASAWGRTTPGYLIGLRKRLRDESKQQKASIRNAKELEKAANVLLDIEASRKHRKRNKLSKEIRKFNEQYKNSIHKDRA